MPKLIRVSKASFEMEKMIDDSPDLSFIGEYSNKEASGAIDRKERGDMERNQFRYFIPTMTGEETGDPDSPEQDYKRMEAYNRGDWGMIGIRARVRVMLPSSQGGAIAQVINSPGIWGIESDSGEDYLQSVFEDECAVLADMLKNFRHIRVVK